MLKKTIFAIFSLLILSSLVGCNTTEGVGTEVHFQVGLAETPCSSLLRNRAS